MTLKKFFDEGVSPAVLLKFHLGFTIIFGALILPSMIWLSNSIPYLVAISVWANFAGHFSAWQAARVEQRQDEIEEDQKRQDSEFGGDGP